MEHRLAKMRSGMPNLIATKLVVGWAQQLSPSIGDLDVCIAIAEIEASNLACYYACTHVERLGSLVKIRPEGIF